MQGRHEVYVMLYPIAARRYICTLYPIRIFQVCKDCRRVPELQPGARGRQRAAQPSPRN